jgi:polyhydroxyalkanoate synthesis regulator protein
MARLGGLVFQNIDFVDEAAFWAGRPRDETFFDVRLLLYIIQHYADSTQEIVPSSAEGSLLSPTYHRAPLSSRRSHSYSTKQR